MVLRWRTTAPRGEASISSTPAAAQQRSAPDQTARSQPSLTPAADHFTGDPNPLRSAYHISASNLDTGNNHTGNNHTGNNRIAYSSSAEDSLRGNPIRPAAYQQDPSIMDTSTAAPRWRSVATGSAQDVTIPPQGNQPNLGDLPSDFPSLNQPLPQQGFATPGQLPQFNPAPGDTDSPRIDPRDQVESAPPPPTGFQQDNAQSGTLQPQLEVPPRSPFPDRDTIQSGSGQGGNRPSMPQDQQNSTDLENSLKARRSSIPDCQTQRDELRSMPLAKLDLNLAPSLSVGIVEGDDKEKLKLEQETRDQFQQRVIRRDWTDYKGNLLANGRMIELRDGNVVVDVQGSETSFPLNTLSDVDMSYIADLWNLPFRCGSGYEPLEGRDFICSTVQWKASGACHNPLYFEQVQLERYGHETGPILQPLISGSHFFLSIPMLPYKMGINPPNECQYALGYYRPGNCAPYMIPPFPLSVRGGLVQAGAVLGVAGVLP